MTEPSEEEVIKKYMSDLGKKGGKATGKCKARSKEHYQKIAWDRWHKEKSDPK